MSIDLIGNGNLPCVYTKSINVDEDSGKVHVECSVYDFVNSNEDLMWTDEGFLKNSVYLYSVVLEDINDLGDISAILANREDKFLLQRVALRDIVKNTSLKETLSSSPTLASVLNFPLNPLANSLVPPLSNNTIEYTKDFTHQTVIGENLHVISFIAYSIEAESESDILDRENKFFIGPITIDTITDPVLDYLLFSESYLKDAQIYKGSFHTMSDGTTKMSGVIHDNNSVLLERITNDFNPKLSVLRNYDIIYEKQNIDTSSLTNPNDVVSKPMISINDNIVTFLFKIEPFQFTWNSSLLAQHNYYKIIDQISAKVTIPYTDGNPELETSRPLRHIRINTSTNSEDLFFEIAAIIPEEYRNGPNHFRLKMTMNFQELLGKESLDSFFLEPPIEIYNKFLNSNTQSVSKSFIKNFLIALSLRYNISQQDLQKEALILLSSLKGYYTQSYKNKLADIYKQIYDDLLEQFTNTGANTFTSNFAIGTMEKRELSNFKNGKAPNYFPSNGNRSIFDSSYIYTNTPNYINIGDLQKRLEDENRRIRDTGTNQILEGRQQLLPYAILNGNKPNIIEIFQENIGDNLDYYKSVEYPAITYVDDYVTNTPPPASEEGEEDLLSATGPDFVTDADSDTPTLDGPRRKLEFDEFDLSIGTQARNFFRYS